MHPGSAFAGTPYVHHFRCAVHRIPTNPAFTCLSNVRWTKIRGRSRIIQATYGTAGKAVRPLELLSFLDVSGSNQLCKSPSIMQITEFHVVMNIMHRYVIIAIIIKVVP